MRVINHQTAFCRSMLFLFTAASLVLAGGCTSGGGDDGDWGIHQPTRTGIDPALGDYTFDQTGCFSVMEDAESGKRYVRFASDCARFDLIEIIDGGFWNEWGEIDGTHCPTDAYAISGSFLDETKAEGTIQYGFDCRVTETETFVAETAWQVAAAGNILEILYREDAGSVQYAALHLDSGYFRLIHSPDAGWGTLVILLPSFWEGDVYYQGAAVSTEWTIEGDDLVISFAGTISSLDVTGKVRLSPPAQDEISAEVTVTVAGTATLDDRPGEAFKPVMLSSMRISGALWDTQAATVDNATFSLPPDGWVLDQPVTGQTFVLSGGTSDWKTNAPTIAIRLDDELQITGWVTPSDDPNDDNVGLWAATEEVLSGWSYAIYATAHR